MHVMNDSQIIGIAVALAGLVGTIAGALVNRYGQKDIRASSIETRQTAIESNLLTQKTECEKRIDAMQREKDVSDAAFRRELDEAKREARKMEVEFRAESAKMEAGFRAEILMLESRLELLAKTNVELEHQNWLLLHSGIGGIELPADQRTKRQQSPLGDGDAR